MKSKDFSQRLKMPPWGKKFPLRVWLQGGFWKHASMERTNWKVSQQNKERPTTYKWSRRKSKHLPYRAFLNQYIAISTTEPYNDSASQKHPRASKISATEIRREGDLGSHQSSMDCLKNPSSSAVRSKLQTEFKDVSKTLERYTEGVWSLSGRSGWYLGWLLHIQIHQNISQGGVGQMLCGHWLICQVCCRNWPHANIVDWAATFQGDLRSPESHPETENFVWVLAINLKSS